MPPMLAPAWPLKTREFVSHHADSRYWNDFEFRAGDVIVVTYAKSGTTWMQQIVGQLIFEAPDNLKINDISKWYDFRLAPPQVRAAIADQTHRRFLKTHLPVDALVISPEARYIYVGRDGRDTAWSYHNHHFSHTDEFLAQLNAGRPGGMPPIERGPPDAYDFYKAWFDGDGHPIWPFWPHVRSWWAIRHLPNVMLIHFNDLKADLEASIRRVASFLDLPVDAQLLPRVVEHCSFDHMKRHAEDLAPRGGAAWKGGAGTFINTGSNGRWRDRLTPADIATYEARALAELGQDCAAWLADGGPIPT